jgi:hypothetical protein
VRFWNGAGHFSSAIAPSVVEIKTDGHRLSEVTNFNKSEPNAPPSPSARTVEENDRNILGRKMV